MGVEKFRRDLHSIGTITGDRGLISRGVPVEALAAMPLTNGKFFHVDSGHANTSDSNGGEDPNRPLATIDAAVAKCTANRGDVILVAPGHAETISAAAGIDLDVAGISLIGMGQGENRPIVTMDTAATVDVDIDAADVLVQGIVFKCDIDDLAVMIDVNAKDATIEDCEFIEGSAKQYLTAIDINGGANGADRAKIRNNRFSQVVDGGDRAIELGEVNDRVEIVGNWINGDWDDAGIHNITGKVLTHLLIANNIVTNLATGQHAIEIVSACTGVLVDNDLHGDTPGSILDPGSLKCLRNEAVDTVDMSSFPVPFRSGHHYRVEKATATLPQTTAAAIFTVAGGRVLVHSILGEVTTVIQTQANNTKLIANPTVGADVDMCAVLDITADAAGTVYNITGTLAAALVAMTSGAAIGQATPVVVAAGAIDLSCAASNTGNIKWYLVYEPLDDGAHVVAA